MRSGAALWRPAGALSGACPPQLPLLLRRKTQHLALLARISKESDMVTVLCHTPIMACPFCKLHELVQAWLLVHALGEVASTLCSNSGTDYTSRKVATDTSFLAFQDNLPYMAPCAAAMAAITVVMCPACWGLIRCKPGSQHAG